MWTAIGLFLGLGFPLTTMIVTICLTVRGHHKRELKANLDARRFEANRETERLLVMKQMWDERAEMIREGLEPPDMSPGWMEAMRRINPPKG